MQHRVMMSPGCYGLTVGTLLFQDLLAADSSRRFTAKREIKKKTIAHGNKEVLASADFRNLEFLNEFVSEGGQILPRSKTKLQAKVHRHLARQIKTARVMALLPHSGELMQQ